MTLIVRSDQYKDVKGTVKDIDEIWRIVMDTLKTLTNNELIDIIMASNSVYDLAEYAQDADGVWYDG